MTMFFAILVAFICAPGLAHAEPISTAFAVFFAASSGGAGFFTAVAAGIGSMGAIATFVTNIIVSAALSLVGQLLAQKPKGIKPTGIQTEQTTAGDTTPQKFIVGTYAAEGHAVAPAYSRGNNNSILTYIIEVSNIPIEGLTGRIIIDGQYTDLTEGSDDASRLDFAGLGFDDAGNPRGWLWFYDGTQTTAQFKLVESYASHPDRPWTNDHILEGTAYAVLEFPLNREIYTGLPSVRFEAQGIRLYDPRKDTSVGGSGTHRFATPSTWEYSGNPQVINYNILRGITLPSGDIYGGQVLAEDLPLDNWFAAMNECDVLIGDRKQYVAGFEINTGAMEPVEVIEEMNRSSFAQISEFGGVFRVRVGAPASPVMSLTDDDFMITEPASYDPFPGLQNTFNAITGTYVEPADVWEGRSADAILNSTWETDDGGRRLTVDVGLPAVSSKSQAQQLLTAYIKDQRRFRVHRMVLPPSFALLEPLDTISWTSAANGYTSKVFEITAVEDRPNTLNQFVTVREREAGDVAWDTGDDVASPDPTNGLTIPARIVPTLTVTAFNIGDGDGTARRPAIKIEWPADEALSADLLKYEVRLAGDTVNLATSSTVGAREGQTVTTDGLVSDTIYEVRAQYVTDMPADWTAWIAVTTGDVRLTAQDIVDAYNARVDQAFERHDQALETLTSGSVFQLLNDTRITDAILAAQNVTGAALTVISREFTETTNATITNDYYTSADADGAIAGQITTFKAELEDPNGTSIGATLAQSYRTEVDTDSAISTAVQTLKATIEDPNGTSIGATVAEVQATRVTAAGAVSAVETAISATYGSLTAMATATAFAEATIDGIESGYVFELNNSNILELVSVQDGVGGTPVSTARISADYVQITGLTQIDDAVITTLAADTGFISNLTVDTLNIAGNAVTVDKIKDGAVEAVKIKDGAVEAVKIKDGAVETVKIKDEAVETVKIKDEAVETVKIKENSVTIPVTGASSLETGNGTFQTMVSVSISLPVISDVLMLWSFEQEYTDTIPTWGFILWDPSTVTTYDTREGMLFGNDYPSGQTLVKNQPAGTFNAQLRWNGQNSDIKAKAYLTVLAVMR